MPKVYCDILQYMKNILRFYHNILFITFSHYSKHYMYLSKNTSIFALFMQNLRF